ncbi:MAG: S-layer protein, partial [Bacteroidales bacterium]|nr:S-layer protein [Bacteroidales bacterium]
LRQIYFCRQIGLNGQAYFRNEFLMNNTKGLFDEVRKSFYQHPALVPPLPDAPQPAPILHGQCEETNTGEVKLSWQAAEREVVFHVYGSSVYPVDTNDAHNLLFSSLRVDSISFRPKGTERYYAVTAANRYGVESMPLSLNSPADGDIPIVNDGDRLLVREGSIYDSNQQELMACEGADLHDLSSGIYLVKKDGTTIGIIIK